MGDARLSLEWAGILSCNNPHSKLVVDVFRVRAPGSAPRESPVFQDQLQILNIQYKVPQANMPRKSPDALFLVVPSNPTHRETFRQYESSFTKHKMVGVVSPKEDFIFLVSPRNSQAARFFPEMQRGHLLGIYFDQSRGSAARREEPSPGGASPEARAFQA